MIITSRERDLGGFSVRRILPYVSRRQVGPFVFFDHMGPAQFAPGQGVHVRPHPHINLATVTYLFEGKIEHRDSLGSDQLIEPGAINWMTAGRGIVHSERTPEDLRKSGGPLNGIQCWVALPEAQEEMAPFFEHHPAPTLPEFKKGDVSFKLLLGDALGFKSPVHVHSDLFYVEVKMPRGSSLEIPMKGRENAFYVVSGCVQWQSQKVDTYSMAIGEAGEDLLLEAMKDSHLMVLGGSSVGPRVMFWNFISSSKSRIEEAKKDWALGPSETNPRFQKVPGDEQEFIPLPEG